MSDRESHAAGAEARHAVTHGHPTRPGRHHEALTRYLSTIATRERQRYGSDSGQPPARSTPTLVGDVMTASVVSVSAYSSFKEILRTLDEHGVSAVPVLDPDGMVLGVVSQADLLAHAAAPVSAGQPSGHLRPRAFASKAHALLARDLMTSPPVTTTPDTSVADAARLAARARVKRLPVIDGNGHLVGIASRSDLLRVFLRSDDEIGRQVVSEVIGERLSLDPATLDVAVHDGVVTVSGTVDSSWTAERLIEEIEALDPVVDVEDRLVRGGSD